MTIDLQPYPAYKPAPLRPLSDIRADIPELERESEGLLGAIIGEAMV